MKKLQSFKSLIQFVAPDGRWEHAEVQVHAYSRGTMKKQVDKIVSDLPCGSVITYDLRVIGE